MKVGRSACCNELSDATDKNFDGAICASKIACGGAIYCSSRSLKAQDQQDALDIDEGGSD